MITNGEPMKLMTITEIAQVLSVSPKTIYYWVSRLEIPFIKVGRHLRFNMEKTLAFFAERTRDKEPACLSDPRLLKGRNSGKNSFHGSLKIRSGNPAET